MRNANQTRIAFVVMPCFKSIMFNQSFPNPSITKQVSSWQLGCCVFQFLLQCRCHEILRMSCFQKHFVSEKLQVSPRVGYLKWPFSLNTKTHTLYGLQTTFCLLPIDIDIDIDIPCKMWNLCMRPHDMILGMPHGMILGLPHGNILGLPHSMILGMPQGIILGLPHGMILGMPHGMIL